MASYSFFFSVILFIFLISSTYSDATNQCAPVTFHNGSTISFFGVPAVNFPSLNQIGLGGKSFQFSLKPCDPDVHVPNAPQQCKGSFLSQTGCDVQFPVMVQGYPKIVRDEFVMIQYTSTSNQLSWTASLNFRCDLAVENTIISPSGQYDAGGAAGQVFLTFNFVSAAFCTDASRGGDPNNNNNNNGDAGGSGEGFQVTWGVVFLIIFFAPLVLYLSIMIPYNCSSGKSGTKVCPHSSFWSSLPGLALDGVTYSWSKVRRSHWESCEGNANGDGAGGASYESRGLYAEV